LVSSGAASLPQVSQQFAASAEFAARYGSVGDAGFVDLVYANVLGRVADPAGRSFWIGRLAAGIARGSVMLGFSDSAEFKLATGGASGVTPPPSTPTTVPPPGPPVTGPHSFLAVDSQNRPLRWDPCAPIRWAVDYSGAHAGSAADLPEAISRVAHRSGLTFEQVGMGSSPMLTVTWATAATDPYLAANPAVAGYASVQWMVLSSGLWMIDADIVLNAGMSFPPGFGTDHSLGILMLHELGHAVGLGHVSQTMQVMTPWMQPVSDYQNGDREGLWRVGAAHGCVGAPSALTLGATAPPPQTGRAVIDCSCGACSPRRREGEPVLPVAA
jgi:hypothetical protein